MSKPSPEKDAASTAQADAPATKSRFELPTEEQLQEWWTRNRNAILVFCGIVILAILARGAYGALAARREAGIEAAFAAATTPAKLQAFVREHEHHDLAGVAYLRLGDDAYAAGQYDEARDNYAKAAAALQGTPFAARATLGEGVSLIEAGKTAEGTALLRQLAEDTNQLAAVRCEAAYHLASLAFDSGNAGDVSKYADLIMQLDPNGIWAQRAIMLRVRTPVAPAATPAPETGAQKPSVSIKLPGS